MKRLSCCLLFILSLSVSASPQEEVSNVLDKFHQAASDASYTTYFSLFSANAVFIGTDAGETWPVDDFKAYAKPYFDKGQGWTYHPRDRHIYFSANGDTAWFDELLDNASYGVTRGTGVLVLENDKWKIAQYHLTIPVPNGLAKEVVKMIRQTDNTSQN